MKQGRTRVLGRIFRSAAVALVVTCAASWTACGISNTATVGATEVDPGPTFGAEVTVTIKGSGRVVSEPATLDCPSKCFARVVLRDPQFDGSDLGLQLRPQASVGYHFAGWTYESVQLGMRARGPEQCSPMLRSTSVLPVAKGTTLLSLQYGETEGTPPAGHEAACAAYKRVPVAYSLTATFEENSVVVTKPPPPGPPVEVLFEPPALGVIVGKQIGITAGRVYWVFEKVGFGSGIASGKTDGSGGGSTVHVPPNDTITQFNVGQNVVLQHSSCLVEAINPLNGARTSLVCWNQCAALGSDATTAFCRWTSGSLSYLYSFPIGGGGSFYVYTLPRGLELALDDERFYFTDDTGGGAPGSAILESAPRFPDAAAGGTPEITKLVYNQTLAHDLRVGPEHLFWLDDQGGNFSNASTAPKVGADAGLVRAVPGSRFLAIDPSSPKTFYVAFSSSTLAGNAYIVKASADSTSIESFRYGLTGIGGLAVDETHVYWTQSDGRVYRAPKD